MVFGVILGTGVGGGIVIDGSAWTGCNAIAGEWGHNGLPRLDDRDLPMPRCYCGRLGCIETYLSGPGLLADHRSRGHPASTVAELAQHARREAHPAERATMRRYYRRLAKSLASVINVLDPDVIVLGGGLSNIDELYEAVPPLLEEFVFSDTVTTPIVKNRHGDSSGVRGAAWLWPATPYA
jgi:fructokinase